MDKWTVIIPTIWKFDKFSIQLDDYLKNDLIDEIILIDNSFEYYNHYESIPDKINLIQQTNNIYVNPAWNLGVEISKTENIIIANDDILFDSLEYIHYLNYFLNYMIDKKEGIGFVGSHSENYQLQNNNNPKIEKYDNRNNKGGWGCLFAFRRSSWIPIPNELKIWYGDNWIHMYNKEIYQLRGFKIETKMSTSSDLNIVSDIKNNDTLIWQKMLRNGYFKY